MAHDISFLTPLVEEFHNIRLDIDLSTIAAGQVVVVETPRRLARELSYSYVHTFWWLRLVDGRSIASVPPGAGEAVTQILRAAGEDAPMSDEWLIAQLQTVVSATLRQAGHAEVNRVLSDLCFACNGKLLRRQHHGDCRRLVDESIPSAEGLSLPTHCFPDGIVYGVIVENKVVSVAYAHRTGIMEEQVADLGVETAAPHRRHGYAQTVVSEVVAHIAGMGGEAFYWCDPGNLASQATARSVGFVPYGASLLFTSPAGDL